MKPVQTGGGMNFLFICRMNGIYRTSLLASVIISENLWFNCVLWVCECRPSAGRGKLSSCIRSICVIRAGSKVRGYIASNSDTGIDPLRMARIKRIPQVVAVRIQMWHFDWMIYPHNRRHLGSKVWFDQMILHDAHGMTHTEPGSS